jgi:hypothetical protein
LSLRFWGREPWGRSLGLALAMSAACWLVFDRLLAVPWPPSLMESWWPALVPLLP